MVLLSLMPPPGRLRGRREGSMSLDDVYAIAVEDLPSPPRRDNFDLTVRELEVLLIVSRGLPPMLRLPSNSCSASYSARSFTHKLQQDGGTSRGQAAQQLAMSTASCEAGAVLA